MIESNTFPAQQNIREEGNLGISGTCHTERSPYILTTCHTERSRVVPNVCHTERSRGILDSTIRIAGIEEESIVDGPGIRLVVFAQGCNHRCLGCHNPETHDVDGGYDIKIEDIIKMVKSNLLLDGITISGGEPFLQAYDFSILAKMAKELGLNVTTYTGYTFEEILLRSNDNNKFKDLLLETDILIDGKFEILKKDLTLAFRGSKNQRLIDVKESIINKRVILWER